MSKRDNKRLALIRQLPCVDCGKSAPNPACHSNFQEHGKGIGTKANDQYTIPLCDNCHKMFDHYISLSREKAKSKFEQWLRITNEWLLKLGDKELPF